jgi:hypothetical protein
MDDRTLRIIVVSASLAAIGALKPWIMPWLRKIGYTGTGLGKDKPEESGDEQKS